MNRRLTLGLLAAGTLAVLLVAAVLIQRSGPRPSSGVELGGPFALTDQNGAPVTDRDLRGKPTAIFFGFTYCPEVCPTTLARQTAALKALGRDAERLNVVFLSVDPERDTPAVLKRYLSDFDPRIRGLTGSPQAVAQALAGYHVYAKKVPLEGGGYTMDHSSATYLFDRGGGFQGLIGYQETPEAELAKLRDLVAGRPPSG